MALRLAASSIELVARALERDPLAEVPGHDPAGGAVDRVDPAEHAAAHQEAAGEPEQQGERETPAQRLLDQRLDLQTLLDVAPDQEAEAAGEPESLRPRPALLDRLAIGADLDRERHPAVRPGLDVRPAAQVAGNGPAARIGQQIDARPIGLRGAPLRDHLAQAARALAWASAVLLGEAGDLGLDGFRGLVLHDTGGGEIQIDAAAPGPRPRTGRGRPAPDGRSRSQEAVSGARTLYPEPRTVWINGGSKPRSIFWRRRLMCTSITLVCGSKW